MLYDFKFGAIFYRDKVDQPEDKNEYFDLTSDIFSLQKFVQGILAAGGGDAAEDWVEAYRLVSLMKWREGNKLVIHIADAGAHGKEYSPEDAHPEETLKLDNYIKKCARKNITIVGFKIGQIPKNSFDRVQKLYESEGNKIFKIQEFDQNKKDPGYFTDLVVNAITKVT